MKNENNEGNQKGNVQTMKPNIFLDKSFIFSVGEVGF